MVRLSDTDSALQINAAVSDTAPCKPVATNPLTSDFVIVPSISTTQTLSLLYQSHRTAFVLSSLSAPIWEPCTRISMSFRPSLRLSAFSCWTVGRKFPPSNSASPDALMVNFHSVSHVLIRTDTELPEPTLFPAYMLNTLKTIGVTEQKISCTRYMKSVKDKNCTPPAFSSSVCAAMCNHNHISCVQFRLFSLHDQVSRDSSCTSC